MKLFFTRLNCFFFICIFATQITSAQWNSSPAINTPVCTTTGNQIDLRMMDDGYGGALIAWKDYRMSMPDIYIQHIDSMGYSVWNTNGVPLCTDPADQSTPAITTDMHHGAIVAWSDWRSGVERDVYAQRIDSLGNILWTTDGVGVANKVEREHNEKIISDGAGGAIIAWEQQNGSTGQWDIWIQRINSNGVAVWPVGGKAVCTYNANRLNPKIQSDGKGGTFVTWQDYRAGNYDIYAQHINSAGVLKWGGNGKVVCNAINPQTDPKIDPDSLTGGVYIAWTDGRSGFGNNGIYVQRVDSSGNMLWTANGKAVCTAAGNQSAVDILSNPKSHGVILAWKDSRNGANNNDIYAQKLNSAGTPKWAANGVLVTGAIRDQINPNITGTGDGGVIIAFQDSSSGNWDIRSQKLDSNGVVQWTVNGVDVGVAANIQGSPKNVSDHKGGCIYAWQDKRSGTYDIYVHKIITAGTSVGIAEQNIITSANCFPNPFNEEFTLNYSLLKDEKMSVRVLNAMGEEIEELVSGVTVQSAGAHSIKVNAGKNYPAGIYFVKFSGANSTSVVKVVKTN